MENRTANVRSNPPANRVTVDSSFAGFNKMDFRDAQPFFRKARTSLLNLALFSTANP